MSTDPLAGVFSSIADGTPIDWAAADTQATDADARDLLAQLKVVAEMASANRLLDAAASPDRTREASLGRQVIPPDLERWGRYELIERLGRGTFGTVYRAWDPDLERHLAIKLIHPIEGVKDELKSRVLQEGRAIARVTHPNVVSIYGVEVHDGQVGLCMELVKGKTLDEIVRTQGKLGAQEATMVGQTICRALAAVHGAQMVHRDVKARNVMREDGGRIVLMDFGAGQVLRDDRSARRGVTQGTPIYMAPEALAGRPGSVTADIYSTGVLLFFLVSGRYPVEGATTEDVERAHVRGQRSFVTDHRPDLPMSFVQAVEKALDPDPSRRQASASRLLVDLLASDVPSIRPEPGPSLWQQGYRVLTSEVARVTSWIALGVLLAFGLGFLNSWAYYYSLSLDASFLQEGPLTWLQMGFQSMVAPVVLGIAVSVLVLIFIEILALVRRASSAADEAFINASSAVTRTVHRVGLTPAAALASLVVLFSIFFVLWIRFGHFAPLIEAALTPLDTGRPEQLWWLSPANESLHSAYRQTLTLGTLVTLLGLGQALRLATRRGERLRSSLLAAGIATTVLSVGLLDMPYRILWRNEAERITLNGNACYVVAERTQSARLFCPAAPVRFSVVPADSLASVRQAKEDRVLENIFTTFATPATSVRR